MQKLENLCGFIKCKSEKLFVVCVSVIQKLQKLENQHVLTKYKSLKKLSVVFENCKSYEKIENAKVIKFVWFYKMQKLGTLCGF